MDKTTRGYITYKAILYLIFGALMILGSIALPVSVFIDEFNLRKESVTVEATVTSCVLRAVYKDYEGDTQREYDLWLSYEYENKNYESVIHKSSKYDRGDLLKIHIDPQTPEVNYGKNNGILDFLWPLFISIPLSFFGVILLRGAISHGMSLRLNAKVTARVSALELERREDSDGRGWFEHCVYVNYEYNGIKYKNVYWYGAQKKNKTRRRLNKELSQFPQKGETFQIFINPKKPDEILSKAPFKIIN